MTNRKRAEGRVMPVTVAALPFVVTIAGLCSVIFFWQEVPLYASLIAAWAVAVGIARRYGHSWQALFAGTYAGMKSTFFVIGILLLIAGVISAWLASGTVPGLIWYGIQLVRPDDLVVIAFLLAAGTSMVLGTSIGTLSTMGAALAGMAAVYGISPALIGGALISGAMIGDRTSPLSSSYHLLAGMTATRAEDNYRPLMSTGLPMMALCAALFWWFGSGKASGSLDPLQSPIIQQMQAHFQLPWYIMLPPLLVLLIAVFRVKITRNLGLGILFGLLLAVFVQGESWLAILRALWFGYDLSVDGARVLHGGGIWPMFNQVLLIASAGALNGLMERTGMMGTLLQVLLDRIQTGAGLVRLTVCVSIAMALLACNQSLAIIVPARAMRSTYDQMEVPPRYLVRAIADSGMVVSALIPWNLHGILCSTAIGISTSTYFGYAIYLWGLPIVALLLASYAKNNKNSDKLDKLLQF